MDSEGRSDLMARKRRNKSEISGVAILGVLFLGATASIPKEAWIALVGVGVVGFGVWLIVKANSNSSRTPPPVTHQHHRPPSSRNRPRAVEAEPNRGLVFSLDEVEIQDQAYAGNTRELAPAAEEKVRRREDSEFFTVTLEVSTPSSYRLPSAPATLMDENVRWIPAGEFVEVAGEKIPGGMIYVGTGRVDRYAAPEPSLINPKLKVARGVIDIAERLTGYWASYDSISPEARRAYLQWLSSGRKAPHANIGYVFLFFYGLERRVFVDAKGDPNVASEIAGIVSEVERLLAIYGGSGSFSNYAGRFLAFLRMGETPPRRYLAPPPDNQAYGYEMPMELRIGLGQLAADKQRVPAEWALSWALADQNIGKRTPVSRCQDAFAALFKIKYEQLHGDGMVLPQNKTRLKLQYNTASAALPVQALEGVGDIPDVTATSAPRKKLQQIVDECTAELEPYSRYLGRNPDTPEALEGLLQLPIMLWPAASRAELDALKQRIGDGMVVMSFGELAGRLKSAGALSRDKVIALARALESLHIGIEPDVLAGSKTPKAEDTVALFATQIEDGDLRASPAYNAASVTLDLACAVAAADGDTSPEEIMLLSRHVDSWSHLSGAHRKRLKAHLRLKLNQPPTLPSLKKKLEPLTSSAKRTVAAFLAHLAQADGEVSPAEVKLLERVYKVLQLDSQLLYGDLHVAASGASTSTVPTVASISPSTASSASKTGFTLDHERIAQLQRETEQVSALLAQVFVDEQIVEPEEPDNSGASDDTSSICGLDADHSAFLRLLVSRMEWSREELEAVASDMDLMLDGALEHINDMAFEHFDMPITEGEDPLEINPDIMGKLPL